MNYKELLIKCNCHGEVISLTQYDGEDEVYLMVYKYSDSVSFYRRLRRAWKTLIGKGYEGADVVLSSENFNKIKQF